MKFLTGILFSTLILFPSFVYAQNAQSDCSDDYTCTCNKTAYDSVQAIVLPLISNASAAAACKNACPDLEAEGVWELFCGTGLINSGQFSTQVAADPKEIKVPNLSVPIPGLTFTPAVTVDGQLVTNYIGQYVDAIYRLMIAIASIGVVLTIMIGGLRWMMARGDAGAVSGAKESISKAFTALLILLGIVSLVNLVDPTLSVLKPLHLTSVENMPLDLHMDGEGETTPRTDLNVADLVPISGQYISVSTSDPRINKDTLTKLQGAAKELHDTARRDILIVSAFRSPDKQATLFYDECLKTGTCRVPTCNPVGSNLVSKSGDKFTLTGALAGETNRDTIIKTLADNANIGNCPHTSSVAVDVYCVGSRRQALDVECTNLLTTAMINNGFCRIKSEPWHFELQDKHVSSDCSTSNNTVNYSRGSKSYTPASGCAGYAEALTRQTCTCKTWDYILNQCGK